MTGIGVVLVLRRVRPDPPPPPEPEPPAAPAVSFESPLPYAELLPAAAALLALVTLGRQTLRDDDERRTAADERAVIGAAIRGELSADERDAVPLSALSSPARALAWLCAQHRYPYSRLAAAPRGDVPEDVWRDVQLDAAQELDLSEHAPSPADPVGALLRKTRARRTLAMLIPVLTALDEGLGLEDTADRLRAAARVFEGRT